MTPPRAIILRAPGTNCDNETAFAFEKAGGQAESVHIKTQAFYNMYVRYGEEIADQVVIHHKENGGMSRFEKFPYYHKTFLDIGGNIGI